MEIVPVDDPKFGIFLYKNMLPKELNLINRLEKIMEENKENHNSLFHWRPALVGDGETIPDYRDCFDFKIVEQQAALVPARFSDFRNVFFEIKTRLYRCLNDYESKYNIKMEYMEAINFVKYGPGQHFSVHADHGYSYVATVSSVMYLNDEYEGGELYFPNFDLKIKPEYGDIIFFPSAFIYSHASLPVTSGIKYAAVTMFDYNDRAHKHHMFNGQQN